ncbi:MAG: TetR/AcrR family transcriptional regulator [Acidaminococcus sp.]|nr:TetR/AcrR family transcriptional regulator [Acidaminococcus sp.]MCI2100545.1 TetR/AcrR family transcriptional regulator [Acidaminococcus sp.]MCI2114866.1 TetR/AcrR family transcriptional regulator [Acidaminococcus sp.]MCI2117553.1 TetR/AcrR family transcriptional regulator [Acidaminococcus sp.]
MKSDRPTMRSSGTKTLLKDTFLEMLKKIPFSRIRVTELCRRAHVTRGTFYAHYVDIYALLEDVMQDAMIFLDSITDRNCCESFDDLWEVARQNNLAAFKAYNDRLPPCYRLIDIPKYRPLMQDDDLASLLVQRIFDKERKFLVPFLMKRQGVSEFIAENIFWYVVNGSMAVNKRIGWCKNQHWYELQLQLLRFALGGYDSIGPEGTVGKK